MRDKGWTILSVGVNRANQHDLMELGGDSGNAFYIEKGHRFYNTDIIHVINRVGTVSFFRLPTVVMNDIIRYNACTITNT